MISFIRGTVADLTENSAIIESNCIGFEINMTGNALAQLHIGQEVKLHTYFQVREDAMVLYVCHKIIPELKGQYEMLTF